MDKIIIVEDDEITAEHLKYCLRKLGYEVVATASDTLQARTKIKVHQPDLVLLDISLEDASDGIDFAHVLREDFEVPYIYLSSHTDAAFIKKAQETKPYGYLVKPFEPNTLNATIQMAMAKFHETIEANNALLAANQEKQALEKLFYHTHNDAALTVSFGEGYTFYHKNKELFYRDTMVELTHNERLAMALLVSQLGHVISLDALIDYIWADESATYNSVRTLIWRLRSKLPTDVIENSSRQGYIIKA